VQVQHCDVHSMSCMFVCGMRRMGECAHGNAYAISASSGLPGVSRARARAGPTTGLVGWRRLVEVDGGAWGLLAWELVLASLLYLSPMGGFWSRRRERERAR
jgi:hypothetical protein